MRVALISAAEVRCRVASIDHEFVEGRRGRLRTIAQELRDAWAVAPEGVERAAAAIDVAVEELGRLMAFLERKGA